MPVLLVLAAAGAWLLLGSGLMKVRDPAGTSRAIGVLIGIGDNRFGARMLGILEMSVALGFILWPTGLTSLVLGTAYLLVFASAWMLRRRDADCGCFGSASTRVGFTHLAITLIVALSALSVFLLAGPDLGFRGYYLVAAASTVALGAYAVMAPLNQLRSRLAELST